jgi:hypothetical protein
MAANNSAIAISDLLFNKNDRNIVFSFCYLSTMLSINSIMVTINLKDYDVVYISYDEPDAEENWEDLLKWVPNAKRVHGVKGIASAHMAAGRLSTTEKTITIDGDNKLYRDLLSHSFEIDDPYYNADTLINWPSKNIVNGLSYGNGGIKLWPTHILRNRDTNEMAPAGSAQKTDYCLGLSSQLTFHESFSHTIINRSPLQAWRAGFREGVKLCLNKGRRDKLDNVWQGGILKLLIWMTVGADVENGLWAMLGARQGCYYTCFTNNPTDILSDYIKLNDYFDSKNKYMSSEELISRCLHLGSIIGSAFDITEPFTQMQSKLVKKLQSNTEHGYHWVTKQEVQE